jgi:thioredoxin 1
MSANLALTADAFQAEVLESDLPVLVDFWATWCGPCLAIAPHIEAIAAEMEGQAKVFKVDVDQSRSIAEKYDIMSIPTLIVFKNGQEAARHTGSGSKDMLKGFLEKNL